MACIEVAADVFQSDIDSLNTLVELKFAKERFPRPSNGKLTIEIDCNKYVQKESNSEDSTFLHKVKQDIPDDY